MKTDKVVRYLGKENIERSRSISVGLGLVKEELDIIIIENEGENNDSFKKARNLIQTLIKSHNDTISSLLKEAVEHIKQAQEYKMVMTVSSDFKILNDPDYFNSVN